VWAREKLYQLVNYRFNYDLPTVVTSNWTKREAAQVCEDMSDLAFDLFDPDEKDPLERAFHDWNGDPQDFIPGYFMLNAPGWLAYYAAQFRRLAEDGGLRSAQGESR
jgi:hypothetical protein